MFLVDKYTFNQSKIQMLHSDWLNSNFWITVLYFILTYMHACYAGKKRNDFVVKSNLKKCYPIFFLHISTFWAQRLADLELIWLRMGFFFSFPSLKISSFEVSFWFFLFSLINPFFCRNITIFRQKKDGECCHLTKKARFIIQQKRTKSTKQRQIIYNYLWFQQNVNIKKSKGKWNFSKCSDILWMKTT